MKTMLKFLLMRSAVALAACGGALDHCKESCDKLASCTGAKLTQASVEVPLTRNRTTDIGLSGSVFVTF